MAEFAEQIPDNWPNLEHLDMGTLDPGLHAGDEFEARILARCATAKSRYGGLKSLVVAPSHSAIPSTMKMIHDHHSATLVHISLVDCYRVEGHHIQGLLSSCPHLKSFVALCEYRIRPLPVIWTMEPVKDDPTFAARDVDEDHSWKDSGFREDEESRIEHWEGVIGTWGTLNVGDALQEFQNLEELETLELRNMKEFINPAALKASRKHWKKLK
ncbi:hypothetical protein CPB97_003813 [Podila verticillata]|nr:hypothetical protein CPB97_003813 [Podila verticillata]